MRSYRVPTDRVVPTTEEDKRAWAEQMFQRQPALLELPLILVPEHLFGEPEEFLRHSPVVRGALNEWMAKAKEEDLRLSIERPLIPTSEIYIPNTPIGRRFFNIAKAIGEIPSLEIIPTNPNQAYWLKTLHYYWQAKGVLFAYKLLGVIANPIEEQGVLWRYLPETLLLDLDLDTNIDYSHFKLLVTGEPDIRNWAAAQGIPYRFNNPMALFQEIQKQSFLLLWRSGPMNSELNWPSNAQQRDNISARIRLLQKNPWLSGTRLRPPYRQMELDYLDFLKNVGWYGYWLLDLRQCFDEEQFEETLISRQFFDYIKALKAAKELYVSQFEWRGGQPYKTRATNKVQRVEGVIDPLGYLHWVWA
jgi:hypothetical protein